MAALLLVPIGVWLAGRQAAVIYLPERGQKYTQNSLCLPVNRRIFVYPSCIDDMVWLVGGLLAVFGSEEVERKEVKKGCGRLFPFLRFLSNNYE